MWSKWAIGPKYAQIHATFYLTMCCNHLCEMVSRMDGTQWIEKGKCQFKKNHLPWRAGKLDVNLPKISQSHAVFLGIAVNIQIYQIISQFGLNGPKLCYTISHDNIIQFSPKFWFLGKLVKTFFTYILLFYFLKEEIICGHDLDAQFIDYVFKVCSFPMK